MTLDEVLAMTAEDVPSLAGECATALRFRESHRIHLAQQRSVDADARATAAMNRGLSKRQRVSYR